MHSYILLAYIIHRHHPDFSLKYNITNKQTNNSKSISEDVLARRKPLQAQHSRPASRPTHSEPTQTQRALHQSKEPPVPNQTPKLTARQGT